MAVAGPTTQVGLGFWDWQGRCMVEVASKMLGVEREDCVTLSSFLLPVDCLCKPVLQKPTGEAFPRCLPLQAL